MEAARRARTPRPERGLVDDVPPGVAGSSELGSTVDRLRLAVEQIRVGTLIGGGPGGVGGVGLGRLEETVKEQAIELVALRGKTRSGW
jgi:hypothetical protein